MLPRLSACLIVENDAPNLRRCLTSLEGWADEIVVVDTGATDASVAIATSFGAKVHPFQWCDDFSAARNFSLELATGDWILAIDADEELVVEQPEALRAALASSSCDAYFMRVTGAGRDGEAMDRPEPRLFRRDPRIRFHGRVHAQVDSALRVHRRRLDVLLGAALLQAPDRLARRSTAEWIARDLRLAERDTEERAHAPDAWLACALCHVAAGRDEEALAVFERLQALVARTGESDEVAFERARNLAALYARLERLEDAERVLDAGLGRLPDSPVLRFERGRLREGRGELQGAIADLRACLRACTERDMHSRPRDLPARAQALLARLCERAPALAGEAAPDREAELRAELAEHPRQPERLLELAFRLFQQSRLQEALEAIVPCIELDAGSVSALHLLGMVLDRAGQPGYAERAFAASLELAPNDPMALSGREACRGRSPASALPPEVATRLERALRGVHPRLSACLIVKNEAGKLARCLTSLQGWADEFVVVDTGSTDDTVAIAEAFGAKVHPFQWCDDFSAARNFSLELATGDWILAIDADEELVIEDAEGFRRALRNFRYAGYLFKQRNLNDRGTYSDNLILRLFQRHERIRFAQRLHESVSDSLRALGWPVANLEALTFAHDGYVLTRQQADSKRDRNRRLARAEAEAAPEDPHLWYNLVRTILAEPDEALEVFARIEQLLADGAELSKSVYPDYVSSYRLFLYRLGRMAEAEALLDRAIDRYPGHAEMHYERGLMRTKRGDFAAARRDFEACLMPNPYVGSQCRAGISFELPRQALAELDALEAGELIT